MSEKSYPVASFSYMAFFLGKLYITSAVYLESHLAIWPPGPNLCSFARRSHSTTLRVHATLNWSHAWRPSSSKTGCSRVHFWLMLFLKTFAWIKPHVSNRFEPSTEGVIGTPTIYSDRSFMRQHMLLLDCSEGQRPEACVRRSLARDTTGNGKGGKWLLSRMWCIDA